MKINTLFVFLLLFFSIVNAQDKNPWKRVDASAVQSTARLLGKVESSNAVLFQLDEEHIKSKLQIINDTKQSAATVITIPNAKGEFEKFSIHENSNFEPELQAKFPDIRSYSGVGISDPTAVLNFSMSSLGIQTMISRNGNQMEFIEKDSENKGVYVVFDSEKKIKERLPFNCR